MSVATPTALLKVSEVRKSFGGVQAVADCSLSVDVGEVCGLIGPNGAGKSTVVGLVSGAVRPDGGRVWFDGADVTTWRANRRARRGLLRTFQISQAWPRLTVIENVMVADPGNAGESLLGVLFRRGTMMRAERQRWDRAEAILEQFGLIHLRDSPAGILSGGQKRLLELARITMGGAKLALLDEPMAGISPALRSAVLDQVRALQAKGVAFLVVEHDLGVVAELCSRVIVMALGRVLSVGTLEELRQRQDVVDAYLGVTNE
ncbi:MAG TPA: ABC transporter ATP-binding protein [Candidatus Dormibacteraeota bacterium]|nr:ABC transporter ATP-binding protein [Candidatus Dormibacteraeota bacterium]